MNLNKLKTATSTKITNDSFERFIQNARVNEELAKMNKNISFEDAKNYLIELFKNNKDYEIFDIKTELARKRNIVIPNTSMWKKDTFTIWNPNKYCGFSIYKTDELTKYYNFGIVGFSSKVDFKGFINCANEFDEVKEKIDFYINSYDYLKENTEVIKFNDLTIAINWFTYANMKNLTDDCIKYQTEYCKIKNCKNCNKCNMFISKLEYTQNMYKFNELINTFIETICKFVQKPTEYTEEIVENTKNIGYKIGQLGIDITTCSMTDKQYSSATIKVYTIKNNTIIPLYSNNKLYFKKGKEQFELYFALLMEFTKNKTKWLSYAKKE